MRCRRLESPAAIACAGQAELVPLRATLFG